MLIEKNLYFKDRLKDNVVLLTGAGGGIGYEAAKSIAYMGATIIITEIDEKKGITSAQYITNNFPNAKVEFYKVDLSDEQQIKEMYNYIIDNYGFIDVIFNNATITPMGNVEEVPLNIWEKSYRVNFKAPLLLTQLFIPLMKAENKGIIVFVPSSGGAPYMGAYEVFKTAQVELCNTLAGEIDNTNIYTYSIGPGLVKTQTAMDSIEIVAKKMGITTDEFYCMNDNHILDVEEAGCGFALSILLAKKYHGQEIGSIQALLDSGILENKHLETNNLNYDIVFPLMNEIIDIFSEQYSGWKTRNIFEKQWVFRDFKKTVGISAEQFESDMLHLREELKKLEKSNISQYKNHFVKLKKYFEHQYKLLQGFEKNPDKLKENSEIILSWTKILNEIIINI